MNTYLSTESEREQTPLVVWRPSDGRIRLANRAAAETAGLTLAELTGRSVFDLLELNPHVQVIADAVAVGALDSCTHRRARAVTRVLEVDGSREAATAWLPTDDVWHRWPAVSAWPEAAPMALGYVDPAWRVTAVSADVETLLGHEPGECTGKPLGQVLPLGALVPLRPPSVHIDARLEGAGAEATVTLLLAPRLPDEGAGYAFALLGEPEPLPLAGRVTELEQRLSNIAAEVRAAGLGRPGDAGPDGADGRRGGPLDGLTDRQWEIVEALLDGKRVPRIARELFLSQSTVRNHLAALFRRFGVHSQPELIERLRDQARRR